MRTYNNLDCRPAVCCFMLSSFAGDGMKPNSAPSFTNRPIHQSLLNFCKAHLYTLATAAVVDDELGTHFFDMKKIFEVERNSRAGNGSVIVQLPIVHDVGTHGKGDGLVLKGSDMRKALLSSSNIECGIEKVLTLAASS